MKCCLGLSDKAVYCTLLKELSVEKYDKLNYPVLENKLCSLNWTSVTFSPNIFHVNKDIVHSFVSTNLTKTGKSKWFLCYLEALSSIDRSVLVIISDTDVIKANNLTMNKKHRGLSGGSCVLTWSGLLFCSLWCF